MPNDFDNVLNDLESFEDTEPYEADMEDEEEFVELTDEQIENNTVDTVDDLVESLKEKDSEDELEPEPDKNAENDEDQVEETEETEESDEDEDHEDSEEERGKYSQRETALYAQKQKFKKRAQEAQEERERLAQEKAELEQRLAEFEKQSTQSQEVNTADYDLGDIDEDSYVLASDIPKYIARFVEQKQSEVHQKQQTMLQEAEYLGAQFYDDFSDVVTEDAIEIISSDPEKQKSIITQPTAAKMAKKTYEMCRALKGKPDGEMEVEKPPAKKVTMPKQKQRNEYLEKEKPLLTKQRMDYIKGKIAQCETDEEFAALAAELDKGGYL